MNKKDLFSKLFNLSDDAGYEEYLKLSNKNKKEYEIYLRAEVDKYKKSALEIEKKAKELQEKLKQEKDKYRKLKKLIN